MGIELVQWGDTREPQHKRIADPGAVKLILRRMSTGGGPKVMLQDPDGFDIEVQQSEDPGADLEISVRDAKKAAALYVNELGFMANGDWLTVPGTTNRVRFVQSAGTDGLNVPFPAPGRGMLRLQVRNVATFAALLKGAGFSVVTTTGAPVALAQGLQVMIARDPNHFYLEPMEVQAR
jgi:catechol 2,3-dioxygenase-like lactoylglutathione lyase family enzyme